MGFEGGSTAFSTRYRHLVNYLDTPTKDAWHYTCRTLFIFTLPFFNHVHSKDQLLFSILLLFLQYPWFRAPNNRWNQMILDWWGHGAPFLSQWDPRGIPRPDPIPTVSSVAHWDLLVLNDKPFFADSRTKLTQAPYPVILQDKHLC